MPKVDAALEQYLEEYFTISKEKMLYYNLSDAEVLATDLGLEYYASILNEMRQEIADESIDREKKSKKKGKK